MNSTNGHPPEEPFDSFTGLSSEPDEIALIACYLCADPGTLEILKSTPISPLIFDNLRNRHWFETIAAISGAGEPLTVTNILTRLGGGKTDIDRYNFILSSDPYPHKPDVFIKKLTSLHKRRVALNAIRNMAVMLREPATGVDEAITDFTRAVSFLSPPRNALPEIEDSHTLLEAVVPEPKELIEGLLHQGTKLALGGGSKSFKTWSLLDIAISVASGSHWLNFKTTQARVLYLNMEIERSFFRKRISRIANARGITLEPGQLDVWNLAGQTTSFHEVMPKIIDRIESQNYGLVVLDPIYKLYGNLDENKAGDIGLLMNSISQLCRKTGASAAFGAHFSKGNQSQKEAIDRMSGSGVFARDPDTIMTFTAHEDEQSFVVESILRNLPPIKPFVVKWEFPCMTLDDGKDPTRLKKQAGRTKTWEAPDALACLPPEGLSTDAWAKACEEQTGMSRPTFFRIRKDLVISRSVIISKIDNKWKPVIKAKEFHKSPTNGNLHIQLDSLNDTPPD